MTTKKTKSAGKTKSTGKTKREVDAPRVADVTELVQGNREQTAALFAQYRRVVKKESDALPATADMNREERAVTNGRILTDEMPALHTMLDVIDAHAAVFASLAAKDHGRDPDRVETAPARHALELLEALVPLVDELAVAHRRAADLALRLGELTRSVTTPAYAIGNANAAVNPALRSAMAPVNDYYRGRVTRSRPRTAPAPTK